MAGHDIVVVGASAGGVEALKELVAGLPADLPAAVLVVLHVSPYGRSVLPDILRRAGRLRVSHAQDGEELETGRVYVAPPNRHLLVKRGHVRVAQGPQENGHRPAVDPLFRSAARAYGPRVIGVVLSGVLDDGTVGLSAIKQRGGLAVVQDPTDAMYSGMPQNAIASVPVDGVVPVSDMAALLVRLVQQPPTSAPAPVSDDLDTEAEIAEMDEEAMTRDDRPGKPAAYVCPECGGTLYELTDGNVVHFRCRVGHAYSPETLLAEQSDALEEAFWVALRALEEHGALLRRLEDRARGREAMQSALRFGEQARGVEERARMVRDFLLNGPAANTVSKAEPRDDEQN